MTIRMDFGLHEIIDLLNTIRERCLFILRLIYNDNYIYDQYQ